MYQLFLQSFASTLLTFSTLIGVLVHDTHAARITDAVARELESYVRKNSDQLTHAGHLSMNLHVHSSDHPTQHILTITAGDQPTTAPRAHDNTRRHTRTTKNGRGHYAFDNNTLPYLV